MVTAEIISIGDEILIGRTQDTNAHWLAKRFYELGIPVIRMRTIPDEVSVIEDALSTAQATLVVTTGGLGPTEDDVTRSTLAHYFNSTLVEHPPTREKMLAFFAQRNRTINQHTMRMAQVVASADVLANNVGAAPGMRFPLPAGRMLFVLPGVPYEMQHIFSQTVIPFIQANYTLDYYAWATYRTVGIPESNLSILLQEIESNLPPTIKFAYNVSIQSLDLRLKLHCKPEEKGTQSEIFNAIQKAVEAKIARFCYAQGNDSLQAVVLAQMRAKGLRFAAAESCTGGALTARLVSEPNASDVVMGGIIAYDNSVKVAQLGVNTDTLAQEGAVSETVARQMATGVCAALQTDVGIGITGIAGPSGGTEAKPVGTVWIACHTPQGTIAKSFLFEKDRQRNIERSVVAALTMLFQQLKEN